MATAESQEHRDQIARRIEEDRAAIREARENRDRQRKEAERAQRQLAELRTTLRRAAAG